MVAARARPAATIFSGRGVYDHTRPARPSLLAFLPLKSSLAIVSSTVSQRAGTNRTSLRAPGACDRAVVPGSARRLRFGARRARFSSDVPTSSGVQADQVGGSLPGLR